MRFLRNGFLLVPTDPDGMGGLRKTQTDLDGPGQTRTDLDRPGVLMGSKQFCQTLELKSVEYALVKTFGLFFTYIDVREKYEI